MPGQVYIPDGIIIDKRVPIPGLRALRPGRDNGVGGGETSQRGVHPAGVEEVDSEAGFLALTGELVVRAEIAESIPCFSKRFIKRGGGLGAVGVGRDRETAEMVSEQEAQRPARANGESRGPCEVVFRDRRPFFLVPQGDDIVIANVVGGDTIHDSFDLFPVRIVVEARGHVRIFSKIAKATIPSDCNRRPNP